MEGAKDSGTLSTAMSDDGASALTPEKGEKEKDKQPAAKRAADPKGPEVQRQGK